MLKTKRTVTTVLAATLLISALALYGLARNGYGQRVGFQEYKPSYLPSGLTATNGNFDVLHGKGVLPSFSKHINVNLSAPNSWLAEWKSHGSLTNPCSDFPDDKGCNTYTTKHGQRYQLSVNTDSTTGLPTYYAVRFIKNETEIWITVRDFKKNIDTTEWGKVVDSFQAGHYDGLATIHGSASGP